MGRTANVFARVEPKLKNKPAVLDNLNIYGNRNGNLPAKFHYKGRTLEVKFPEAQKPLAYGSLTMKNLMHL